MTDDINLLHILHGDILNNKELLGTLRNIQKTKFNNTKGIFVVFVSENSNINFVPRKCIGKYFPQKEIRNVVCKRIDASNPELDFVVGTVIPNGESFFNNYSWDATRAIKVANV